MPTYKGTDCGVQYELSKQSLKFSYQGQSFNFEFIPEEKDWWTGFQQHGFDFDVHYVKDEDNNICVYLVVDGKAKTDETIYTQKIVL